jgi:hypothetical protein
LYLLLHLHHLLPHLYNHVFALIDVILPWICPLWGRSSLTEAPLQIVHLLLHGTQTFSDFSLPNLPHLFWV